jgi:hypothetical protein
MSEADDIQGVPVGYLYALLMATIFKRALANDPMTTGERLTMLEALNGMVDAWFTTEALAALAPADDATLAIVREAWKLDGDRDAVSFNVLTREEVFSNLARLNPTIMAAIGICTRGRDRAPAPQPPAAPTQTASAGPSPYFDPRLRPPAEPQGASGVDFDLF